MDLSNDGWRKSSFSGGNSDNCIEVKNLGGARALRDTEDADGRSAYDPNRVVGRVCRWRKGRRVRLVVSVPARCRTGDGNAGHLACHSEATRPRSSRWTLITGWVS